MEWRKAQSTQKPQDVDYSSSPDAVYLHRNVRKDDGMYIYDEAKVSHTEYLLYEAAQQSENQIAIMEALTDIYTKIGG